MSSKHRHGLPKKRPDSKAKAEIDAELPVLQPVDDELPTLEPIEDAPPVVDDGPVKVTCGVGEEASFDVILTVLVPAMDKKAVAEAVAGPLRRAATAATGKLRHRRTLVRFTGEAVIGSAVKELVVEILKAHKPLKATVRRGFGDESVLDGALPQVKLTTSEQGGAMRVEVATGDLEAQDLSMALQPQLAALAVTARGRKFVLQFTGAAKPDAAVRAQVTEVLQAAGATRAAIGERVLFDRELAERVRVAAAADAATIDVQPADDEASTIEAISMVLPQHTAAFTGRIVRLRFAKPCRPAELAACVDICRKASASRIELAGQGEPEMLWPKLLTLVLGTETTLRVLPNGRSRVAVLAAFRRECVEHAAATRNGAVVIDWPAAFVLDAEAESCVHDAIAVLEPMSLVCRIGGELRESFLPEVVSVAQDGERHTLRIRSDVGKPVELQRAIDRRMAVAGKGMRGKIVRVQITGGVALSRGLLRSVCGAIDAAGAARLELEDNGAVDVLLPPMLTVTRQGASEVRIAAVAGERDPTQQAMALRRELDVASLPAGATVAVAPSTLAEAVAAAVISRGALRVLLDGPAPVQVHPPLFGVPERKGLAVRLPVQPGFDATMVGRQLDRELPILFAGLGAIATATVTVSWPGAAAASLPFLRLLKGLVDTKAAKVLLDNGSGKLIQAHPPVTAPFVASASALVGEPMLEPMPPSVTAPIPAPGTPSVLAAPAVGVAPGPTVASRASGASSLVTLLGRNEESVPPMVVLGIAAGTDAAHVALVEAALQENLPRLRGRCVLFVLRRGEEDVPIRRDNELVTALRRMTAPVAAATLLFRGPDAQQRPHFQVAHSSDRAFPVGAPFADPRQRR